MKLFYAWSTAAFLCATTGIADTLYFKSGKSYSCQVLGFSNATFTVILDGDTQQAPAANVDRIDFSEEMPSYDPVPSPFSNPYAVQNDEAYTPASYLEGKDYGDATASYTPKALRERIFTLGDAPIKLVFKRRSSIEQIGTNEYTTILYDDDYEAVTIFFDETALKYIRDIRVRYKYHEAQKKFSLYGIAVSPKTLERFEPKYRRRTPVFIPIGRTSTKSLGKDTADYSW